MRIGVISDTHSGGQIPPRVFQVFSGVDLILHAGDLVAPLVLTALEKTAPVRAVYGNMDPASLQFDLPQKQTIEAGGMRLGLIHGHYVPNPNAVLGRPIDYDRLHAYLLSEFAAEEVACIVFGHTHQAHQEMHKKVLMFNPGSPTRARPATVGLMAVEGGRITAEIVEL
ncbi:MAG: metallophosphoesterase family protein [Anaerolineae bacterium]